MARESPNQKRKRGAPAEAAHSDALRRAARSRNTDNGGKATESNPGTGKRAVSDAIVKEKPDKSSRRGRPKKEESTAADVEADVTRDGIRRSKRDRRSADDNTWWISGASGPEGQQEEAGAPPRKRARVSQDAITTQIRKQGSRSRSRAIADEASPVQPRPVKPTRSSNKQTAPDVGASVQPEPGNKRRGRPRKSDIPPAANGEAPVVQPPLARKRAQPRLPSASATGRTPTRSPGAKSPATNPQRTRKAPAHDDRRTSTASQRRRTKAPGSRNSNVAVAEMDNELEASLPPVPKYRHIEPQVRHISKSVIKAKWAPLDGASIDAFATMLSDASRPVLLRLRDKELRHQQGQNILRIFAGRLRSKLRKGMPFPPPTTTRLGGHKGDRADGGGDHVGELNFESIVASIESLESVLDPLLHSVALLEKEKAKEEAALEKEYGTLRTLELNARAEARVWRERMKKAHPLAPEPDGKDGEGLALSKQSSTPLPGLFHDMKDEGLLSMSQQIASHMESIQKNVQPVQEVLPAIGQSRAALQSVLQTHLSPQQLEKVLIG